MNATAHSAPRNNSQLRDYLTAHGVVIVHEYGSYFEVESQLSDGTVYTEFVDANLRAVRIHLGY